jgi:hypothetical protein
MKSSTHRQFNITIHVVALDCLQLGFHVCLSKPNIEIHLPFGFIRAGWNIVQVWDPPLPPFPPGYGWTEYEICKWFSVSWSGLWLVSQMYRSKQ